MNFTIQKDEFEKLLGKVKGIPSKSSMLPILTCLHLKTKGDGVFVYTSLNISALECVITLRSLEDSIFSHTLEIISALLSYESNFSMNA